MATIRSLNFVIRADGSPFRNEFARTQRALSTQTAAMGADIGSFSSASVLALNEVTQSLVALASIAANVAQVVSSLDQLLTSFENALGAVARRINSALNSIKVTALALSAGYIQLARSSIVATDELVKQAQAVGLTANELRSLQFVFERTGIAGDRTQNVLSRISTIVREAARGSEEYRRSLLGVGLSYRTLQNLSPLYQFERIRQGLSQVSDISTRLALQQRLLGEEVGRSAGTLVNLTLPAYQELFGTLERIGGVLQADARQAELFSDLMGTAADVIRIRFADAFFTVFETTAQFSDFENILRSIGNTAELVGRALSGVALFIIENRSLVFLAVGAWIALRAAIFGVVIAWNVFKAAVTGAVIFSLLGLIKTLTTAFGTLGFGITFASLGTAGVLAVGLGLTGAIVSAVIAFQLLRAVSQATTVEATQNVDEFTSSLSTAEQEIVRVATATQNSFGGVVSIVEDVHSTWDALVGTLVAGVGAVTHGIDNAVRNAFSSRNSSGDSEQIMLAAVGLGTTQLNDMQQALKDTLESLTRLARQTGFFDREMRAVNSAIKATNETLNEFDNVASAIGRGALNSDEVIRFSSKLMEQITIFQHLQNVSENTVQNTANRITRITGQFLRNKAIETGASAIANLLNSLSRTTEQSTSRTAQAFNAYATGVESIGIEAQDTTRALAELEESIEIVTNALDDIDRAPAQAVDEVARARLRRNLDELVNYRQLITNAVLDLEPSIDDDLIFRLTNAPSLVDIDSSTVRTTAQLTDALNKLGIAAHQVDSEFRGVNLRVAIAKDGVRDATDGVEQLRSQLRAFLSNESDYFQNLTDASQQFDEALDSVVLRTRTLERWVNLQTILRRAFIGTASVMAGVFGPAMFGVEMTARASNAALQELAETSDDFRISGLASLSESLVGLFDQLNRVVDFFIGPYLEVAGTFFSRIAENMREVGRETKNLLTVAEQFKSLDLRAFEAGENIQQTFAEARALDAIGDFRDIARQEQLDIRATIPRPEFELTRPELDFDTITMEQLLEQIANDPIVVEQAHTMTEVLQVLRDSGVLLSDQREQLRRIADEAGIGFNEAAFVGDTDFLEFVSGQAIDITNPLKNIDIDTDLIEPALTEAQQRLKTRAESFGINIGNTLTSSIATGNFASVGDALVTTLVAELAGSLVKQGLNFLGNLLFPNLGLSFHEGGIVPGRRGADVPIIAQAGELVLTEGQQRALLSRPRLELNQSLQLTGDVTEATRRAMLQQGKEMADVVQQQFAERRLIAS